MATATAALLSKLAQKQLSKTGLLDKVVDDHTDTDKIRHHIVVGGYDGYAQLWVVAENLSTGKVRTTYVVMESEDYETGKIYYSISHYNRGERFNSLKAACKRIAMGAYSYPLYN